MKFKELNNKEIAEVRLIGNIYDSFRDVFYDYNQGVNKLGYYNAIPIYGEIITHLYLIKKNFPLKKRLMDVGCGKGNVIRLAKALGFMARGIEYRQEYKEILRYLSYTIGDAFDYKDYSENDIIYAFMPIVDDKKMSKLFYYIDEQIKIDTLILFYGGCELPKNWTKLRSNIYIKTTNRL